MKTGLFITGLASIVISIVDPSNLGVPIGCGLVTSAAMGLVEEGAMNWHEKVRDEIRKVERMINKEDLGE